MSAALLHLLLQLQVEAFVDESPIRERESGTGALSAQHQTFVSDDNSATYHPTSSEKTQIGEENISDPEQGPPYLPQKDLRVVQAA
jgi:hypothetical protein